MKMGDIISELGGGGERAPPVMSGVSSQTNRVSQVNKKNFWA